MRARSKRQPRYAKERAGRGVACMVRPLCNLQRRLHREAPLARTRAVCLVVNYNTSPPMTSRGEGLLLNQQDIVPSNEPIVLTKWRVDV